MDFNLILLVSLLDVMFLDKFQVSKENVVLRRLESETWQCGCIKRVDKGRITPVKDLES